MLDLRIAGRQLLLPASTTASIEYINPLFADGLQDSHSVPITAANSSTDRGLRGASRNSAIATARPR